MSFFAGALEGSRNMLGRRLANMYRDERDAIVDDRWERTHALNRATTLSNLRTAEQGRTFAAALHPHQLTAAELTNQGTEQAIEQSADLHPGRVRSLDLANALSGQTYQQRGEQHPLNMQLMRGQITQQGLTSDRMRDDNAFMQTYRPGLLEAQRIGNEANEISLRYLPQQLQEQVRAMRQATDQSAELHPWNLAMSASRYGLSQAQLERIQQMLPWEVQQLQANINLLNARALAEGQPTAKSPTFRSEYYDMAQARGRGFATKIDQLKKRKGWFAGSMSEYQILEMAKQEGLEIRRSLGNAFQYTPDDIHRYASGFIQGMADPEVSEQYNAMLQRIGKNPQGISRLEGRIFNAFWRGIYGTPDPKLTPEQQKQIGEGVTDDGWFNWGNLGLAGAGYTGVATLGGLLPGNYGRFFRYTNPARVIPRAGQSVWRGAKTAGRKIGDIPTTLRHSRNLKADVTQRISDLSAQINQEFITRGAANPTTQQALEAAIAEAKRLGL